MAIVTRRYVFQALPADDLENVIGSSAAVIGSSGATSLDIEIDDSVDGILDALDSYMERRGFLLSQAPIVAPETSLRLVSPDGTAWTLSISNLGVPVIVPV